jgi:uncharacterized protein YoxC
MVVIAISAAVVAVAFVLMALSVRGLGRDASDLAKHSDALITVLEREVPPTIQQVRELSASVSELSSAAQPRLERIDSLLEEAEATLIAVREVSSSLNGLVGGPAATVSSVKRGARSMAEGVASGADRILRAISRDERNDEGDGKDGDEDNAPE